MEKATEALMREGSRKRDCPDSELESHQILAHEEKFHQLLAHEEKSQQILAQEERSRQFLARQAIENAFWDHVDESNGLRLERTDANHAEQKPSGWKVDLPSVLKEGEGEEEADDDEEDNDDPDVEALRFIKRWNFMWSPTTDTSMTPDPYVVLTGPARAVVFSDIVTIEVYLKVKGPTELEDKTLCFLAEEMTDSGAPYSYMFHQTWSSKFSTMEFTLEHITSSVEATISVRVISGSWPHGFQGEFAACLVRTGDIFHGCKHEGPVIGGRTRRISVDHKKITLLSFGDEKVPVIGDGVIALSCSVVSAKSNSNLEVSVREWQDGKNAVQALAAFAAKEAGSGSCTLDIGSCKMVVIVAWSLISNEPEPR